MKKDRGEAIRRAYQDPEVKRRHKEGIDRYWATPESREKARERARRADHTNLANTSAAAKRRWSDPAYREKQSKSRSEGAKRRWADPDKRAALMEKIVKANKERSKK